MPLWVVLVFAVAIVVNALAGIATNLTVGVMRSVSAFANEVRAIDTVNVRIYNLASYPVVGAACLFYLWPLIRYFRAGAPQPPPPVIQRRALAGPAMLARLSFLPWLVGLVLFPSLTVYRFGYWSTDLMSQQVLSPLVNGFLAAATLFFLVDLIFRTRVIPHVFATVPLVEADGVLGLWARLLVFLAAVAFLPLFTMLGLARGAGNRLMAGVDQAAVIGLLNQASSMTFVIYVALGIFLTLVLTRSLTRPLAEVAKALRRIQAGDLEVAIRPTANDEVGVVEDGVNRMAAALRDRERILQTFGRIVEPTVRDHLLNGTFRQGGELRSASVMFCDLRGFTAFAEAAPADQVVETLNEFFTTMTAQVRAAGGFVDKFIGDALLVVFGLFDEDSRRGDGGAAAALACAAAMSRELEALNLRRAARGMTPLRIAGGIHTGDVVAGLIGAADRHEFTVVGDTVNVAARLQEVCKSKGWQFLASEATVQRGRGAAAMQESDAVSVRGRNEPVLLYRLS